MEMGSGGAVRASRLDSSEEKGQRGMAEPVERSAGLGDGCNGDGERRTASARVSVNGERERGRERARGKASERRRRARRRGLIHARGGRDVARRGVKQAARRCLLAEEEGRKKKSIFRITP